MYYLPYDENILTPSFRKLTEGMKGAYIELLDANVHHSLWGSTSINQRAESLLKYSISYDLEILKRGNEATYIKSKRSKAGMFPKKSHALIMAISDLIDL